MALPLFVPVQAFMLVMDTLGFGFTVRLTVRVMVHPPARVTVKVYVPPIAVVALERTGFCKDDEKLRGPIQE